MRMTEAMEARATSTISTAEAQKRMSGSTDGGAKAGKTAAEQPDFSVRPTLS